MAAKLEENVKDMLSNGEHNSHANGSDVTVVPLLIDGKDYKTKTTFDVDNPAEEKVVWKVHAASVEDANHAVETAHKAFPAWSKTSPSERRDIFLKAANIMEGKTKELSELMEQETGATSHWAAFNIITTVEMLRDISGRIATAVEGFIPWCADTQTNAMVLKEPYGIILAIAPWNAPYILGMRSIAYPIAAGNTAVLKGSELSPRIFYTMGKIFLEAGLPAGVLNVIYHEPKMASEVTTALIANSHIKKVNFTGSTGVGKIIAQTAGKYLKPVLLELGGKAPAIVCPDADLEKAAKMCAIGAYFNAGQICMSTEKVVVHSSIKEKFSEIFRQTVEHVFNPKDDAPVLITAAGVSKTKKLVEEALAAGAKSLNGAPDFTESSKTRMRPIILDGVTKDMDLYYAESFGPHVTLLTYETEDEAVAIANDTEYGLSSAVFTEDLGTGLRIAKKIEVGAVHINHMTVHDEPRLPHGGVKSSGFGRFGGNFGIEEFLRSKTITFGIA